jgi:peptide/nickel transport system substrate-binding protein
METGNGYWQRLLQGRISRRRGLIGATGAAGLAALTLAGCGGGAGDQDETRPSDGREGTPKPGGILRTADNVVAPHFSPYHRGADPSWINTWRRVTGYYDKLWGLRSTTDPARLVHLQLASSIEQVDDLTVVVKMRSANYQDVPQSKTNSVVNGRVATAEDFAASFEFMKAGQPGEILASAITTGVDLKSVTAVDLTTDRYDMFRPLALFFESGSGGANAAYAIPKEMLQTDTLKQDFPIGTGPFQYKSHQVGSMEELARNPNYFLKDRPYLEGKRVTFVPDAAAQEAAFRANQVDTIGFTNVRQKDAVAADLGRRISVITVPGGGTGLAFMCNISRKPFDDIRVREALYRAVDVDRIINIVWFGDAVRSWFFAETNHSRFPIGYKAVEKYVSHDPKRAADLLRAANVDPNKTFELMVPVEAQTWVDAGRLAADDWGKAGIKVRLDPQVRSIYLSRGGAKPGDFDMTMGVFQDYRAARTVPGYFWENTSLEDAEIDALVADIYGTVDAAKRKELSHKFELRLAEKYSNFMPILVPNSHTGMYAYIKGRDMEMSTTGLGGWQPNLWFDRA